MPFDRRSAGTPEGSDPQGSRVFVAPGKGLKQDLMREMRNESLQSAYTKTLFRRFSIGVSFVVSKEVAESQAVGVTAL
jgi:hypothetical protein